MNTEDSENTTTLTADEPTTCSNVPLAGPGEQTPEQPPEHRVNTPSGVHPNPANPLTLESTIPTKLPPDILAAVHEALAAPERPSYRTIYEKFALHEKNIGFTAFFNYARPIRLLEACQTQAGLSRRVVPDQHKMFPDLIAGRLLSALVDETVSPRQIQYLVDAYRMASNLDLAHRRIVVMETAIQRKAKSKELGELSRAFKEYSKTCRTELAAGSGNNTDINDEAEQ